MPSMRSFSRPSIHDLATFLLSPPKSRSLSHLCARRASLPPTRPITRRPFTHHASLCAAQIPRSSLPQTHDRGPVSNEPDQTDFGALNMLANTPAPSTSIDACLWDGFHLDSGVKIVGSGVLLVAGEAFAWQPWKAGGVVEEGMSEGREGKESQEETGMRMVNRKEQWDVGDEAWGLLGLVWPKPDLLILGLGKDMRPISPRTRKYINSLGIRIDVQDTRNAAAQFNLLATERGVGSVAAALVPLGWKEGVGFES